MDYRTYHSINEFFADHTWLAHLFSALEGVLPVLLGVATFALWLFDRPGGGHKWKLASASALAAGALIAAVLISAGRVFVGAHYPADVLAGCAIGIGCALVVVRLARPFLAACVRLVERLTDPLVAPAWRLFERR